MKGSNRQRSPGNLIRTGDTMDEPSNTSNTAEPEEFVPNVHPPTDDEGVSTSDSFYKYFDSNDVEDNKRFYQRRARKLLLYESNACMQSTACLCVLT